MLVLSLVLMLCVDTQIRFKHTDMKEEMRTEAIEVTVSSVEKLGGKYDLAVSFRACRTSCHRYAVNCSTELTV